MFGIGGSEILVILVIALLFLGPDKLPDAAKQISKVVRDLKKQSRTLQQTIENDETIGGAIRDLKSAMRGDEIPVRPPPRKLPAKVDAPENTILAPGASDAKPEPVAATPSAQTGLALEPAAPAPAPVPVVTLPPTAGEANPDVPDEAKPEDLAALIKPATGETAAREPADKLPAGGT